MKKSIAIIMMCVMLILPSVCISAMGQESVTYYNITFNGESTGYVAFMDNGVYYVPMRKVFEMLGGILFYRSRDCSTMTLTRDGHIITHVVGSNELTVNGEKKTFNNSSFPIDNETYITMDMVSAAFAPNCVFCADSKLDIQKEVLNLDYHKNISTLLSVCKSGSFHPEKFHKYINYLAARPDLGVMDVIYQVNIGLDAPFYEDIVISENPYDYLVLVNKYNKLPQNFTPNNLVNMEAKYTIRDGKQYLLTRDTYASYVAMAEAAKKEGYSLKAVSTYRTEDYQGGLYNYSVRVNGKVHADTYSARPGHSEHQTGLAVDINSTEGVFEYTREFKWLCEHAHEYGFIMRYPKGKEWITGYGYEPWHYRYVGVDAAKIIKELGITYEEYYVTYVAPGEYK